MSTDFDRPVNHVAISVPDAQAAARWCIDILGFTQLLPPITTDRSEAPDAPIFQIYPAGLNKVRIVFLNSGNGVGVELFEFQDPEIQSGNEASFERDYKRGGFFRIGVTGRQCLV
ncbi:hypothetical protein BJ170DRAFT_677473 [Xylariales sp. AK1849]|nr:hypothetical protein BJ170DRAFT_677473 [Xylariales sp. AK1849]